MVAKVAINGFGRIGRLVLRGILESGRKDIEVVAINDLGPVETNAHLLRYDSIHGRFPHKVKVEGDTMVVDGHKIKVTAIKDPAELPHKALGVDIALECTGIFTAREKAAAHLKAGAKRVLISAPAEGADLTVVYGVNDDKLTKDHLVVSNASCTTNCLAPVAKVLNDAIGIEHGFMTTIHSYTGDQPTLDTLHKDLYRARGAALVDDPDHDRRCESGRSRAAGAQGQAGRFLDPRADAERLGRRLQVCRQAQDQSGRDQQRDQDDCGRQRAAQGHPRLYRRAQRLERFQPRRPLLDLPSRSDQGDRRKFVRVLSWYDNEWGFSNRMADTAVAMAKLI